MARFHKPLVTDPQQLDIAAGGSDPAEVTEVAHRTAATLVGVGRESEDPQANETLVELVREVGLSTLAEMWADRPARTLPGALWRLYLLHEWVQRQPEEVARAFTAGASHAEVYRVIVGVTEPPQPQDLRELTLQILHGVFQGDLADALDRAAAFCHVMAVGLGGADAAATHAPSAQVHRAGRLQGTAGDLSAAAALWRKDDLR